MSMIGTKISVRPLALYAYEPLPKGFNKALGQSVFQQPSAQTAYH